MNRVDAELNKFITLTNGATAVRVYLGGSGTAETGIPDEASDGDTVGLWLDEYGRLVIKGYNLSEDALNVLEQAPAGMQTAEYIDTPLLDAVTATGASYSIDVSQYNRVGFNIVASSVSSGATVKIQGSHDGTNWADLDTESITADGTTDVQVAGKFKYLRSQISSYTDGTITVTAVVGR